MKERGRVGWDKVRWVDYGWLWGKLGYGKGE